MGASGIRTHPWWSVMATKVSRTCDSLSCCSRDAASVSLRGCESVTARMSAATARASRSTWGLKPRPSATASALDWPATPHSNLLERNTSTSEPTAVFLKHVCCNSSHEPAAADLRCWLHQKYKPVLPNRPEGLREQKRLNLRLGLAAYWMTVCASQ